MKACADSTVLSRFEASRVLLEHAERRRTTTATSPGTSKRLPGRFAHADMASHSPLRQARSRTPAKLKRAPLAIGLRKRRCYFRAIFPRVSEPGCERVLVLILAPHERPRRHPRPRSDHLAAGADVHCHA